MPNYLPPGFTPNPVSTQGKNDVCNPPKAAPIEDQLLRVEQNAEKIRSNLDFLEDRLCSILKPEPQDESATGASPSYSIPMADRLKYIAEQQSRCIDQLNSIIERIAL